MGVIMIRCPTTKRAVSTGIEVDRAAFRASPVFFSRTPCPFCHLTHEWFAKDAWVCETGFADEDADPARRVA